MQWNNLFSCFICDFFSLINRDSMKISCLQRLTGDEALFWISFLLPATHAWQAPIFHHMLWTLPCYSIWNIKLLKPHIGSIDPFPCHIDNHVRICCSPKGEEMVLWNNTSTEGEEQIFIEPLHMSGIVVAVHVYQLSLQQHDEVGCNTVFLLHLRKLKSREVKLYL